jgi:hypothetical protein
MLLSQNITRISIHGKVSDAETNEPLYYANVFLSNTTLGCASDKNGNYVISQIPMGSYDLVVSMVGYEMESMRIHILELEDLTINFQLKPKAYQAPTISVSAPNPVEWKRHLKLFQRVFLGSSDRASKCEILNPEILDFDYNPDSNALTAKARESLKIVNHAIGYKIEFHLLDFTAYQDAAIRYMGKTRFEYINPETKKEEKSWEKEREKVYHGSIRHFFESLLANRLTDEGFLLYKLYELKAPNPIPILGRSILKDGEHPFEKVLKFDDYLKVMYIRDMPHQVSYLKLNADVPATLSPTAQLTNPYAITKFGHWGEARLAEELPMDYKPN